MKVITKKIGKFTIQARVFTEEELAEMDETTRNALIAMRGLTEDLIVERIRFGGEI